MQLLVRQKGTNHLIANYSVLMRENSLHVIFHDISRKDV